VPTNVGYLRMKWSPRIVIPSEARNLLFPKPLNMSRGLLIVFHKLSGLARQRVVKRFDELVRIDEIPRPFLLWLQNFFLLHLLYCLMRVNRFLHFRRCFLQHLYECSYVVQV
jgi:hypothetical protein